MSDIWLTAVLMVVCLIAEGFFSGSELGVVSADRMKLRHAAAKGSRGARLASCDCGLDADWRAGVHHLGLAKLCGRRGVSNAGGGGEQQAEGEIEKTGGHDGRSCGYVL